MPSFGNDLLVLSVRATEYKDVDVRESEDLEELKISGIQMFCIRIQSLDMLKLFRKLSVMASRTERSKMS